MCIDLFISISRIFEFWTANWSLSSRSIRTGCILMFIWGKTFDKVLYCYRDRDAVTHLKSERAHLYLALFSGKNWGLKVLFTLIWPKKLGGPGPSWPVRRLHPWIHHSVDWNIPKFVLTSETYFWYLQIFPSQIQALTDGQLDVEIWNSYLD